ncbi:hypothetical protein SALBM311S_12168 [Streptomyces alboniger]
MAGVPSDPARGPGLGHRAGLDRPGLHHLGRHRLRLHDKWVGLQNFRDLLAGNPQFWPAVQHNVIWFVVLILIPTPLGLFLAVQLDKKIRFSRVYQTALFLPVVGVAGGHRLRLAADLRPREGPDQEPHRRRASPAAPGRAGSA